MNKCECGRIGGTETNLERKSGQQDRSGRECKQESMRDEGKDGEETGMTTI